MSAPPIDDLIAHVDAVVSALNGTCVVKCDSIARCSEVRDSLMRRTKIVERVSGKRVTPKPSEHLCTGCEAHWVASDLLRLLRGLKRDRDRLEAALAAEKTS